ncbi:MAG: hypothetical protein ACYCXU_07745 [Thermoleophilia bacterium]
MPRKKLPQTSKLNQRQEDVLTGVLRKGAVKLLAETIETREGIAILSA